jgi:hypothetical protein
MHDSSDGAHAACSVLLHPLCAFVGALTGLSNCRSALLVSMPTAAECLVCDTATEPASPCCWRCRTTPIKLSSSSSSSNEVGLRPNQHFMQVSYAMPLSHIMFLSFLLTGTRLVRQGCVEELRLGKPFPGVILSPSGTRWV